MPAEPHPSATVIPVRDADAGLEVLLLERARRAGKPGPGPWVFPGGKIEDADRGAGAEEPAPGARSAAVREAREEAGLELAAERLVTISRWITPEMAGRRFDTWFFVAPVAPAVAIRVDGGEIASHRWYAPLAALRAHCESVIRLAPPTFVTLLWLAEHRDADSAVRELGAAQLVTFRPRICPIEGGACILYPGDAGYEAADPERPGERHRLWSEPGGYRYERTRGPGAGTPSLRIPR